ncbi:MAG: HU family DNA-binding protein [SAR324 cluster bacterium]|nr:HU family DNA-binding protein [SAR324 cluster bacterium]
MVKVDIVRKLQRQEGLLFGESEAIINTLIEIVKETLESGEEVLIIGFGKFDLRDKCKR